MPNFSIEQILEIMGKPEYIRNVSVVSHKAHGKTVLVDCLLAKAGLISSERSGGSHGTSTRKDEQERGLTIKSTSLSIYFDHEFGATAGEKEPVLINLTDSPGHADFSSEVTAALRVTDGAIVVVDFLEGVAVQTETVLRAALQEKIKPILVLNKMDRKLQEAELDAEEIYQRAIKIVENINVVISTYQPTDMPNLQVYPENGTVAFGSGLQMWYFTLKNFARMYSKKFGIEEKALIKKFWGDHYYDTEGKKWTSTGVSVSGKPLKRAFCAYIMDPIIRLTQAIYEKKPEVYTKMLAGIGVKLTPDELLHEGKDLVQRVFSKWLSAADTLIELIVNSLPSPKVSQIYRCQYLYTGPPEDACAKAIRECDPKGPLVIYICKMIPSQDKGRFYAFGRVFSGTVTTGQKVRILGMKYTHESKEDLYVKNIQRTVIMMGKNIEAVPVVPCGNTVGLVGVDQYLVKNGTITDSEIAHPIRAMKYSVSPVVRVAVQPKNPAELPKLIEGLKRMAKSDPLVQVTTEESGENIVAGCGEMHLEVCIKDLIEEYAKIDIIKSDPVVSYKETVTEKSSMVCLSKSANKHNRLYVTAEPLPDEMIKDIEGGKLGPKDEPKARVRTLVEKFGWDSTDAKKLWVFGPDDSGPNMVVDQTKAVQYLNEIRDSLESAFQWVTKEAVMTEEHMRGIRFNIMDVTLHSDAIHRGGGQVIPTARRVYYASELTAAPRLYEPIFSVDITCPAEALGNVYTCIATRRGAVVSQESMPGTPLNVVKAYLPVAESFGFTAHLQSMTSGQASPQCVFDHWDIISQDPLVTTSKANAIVEAIRKRKGLKPGIPSLENFIDRL
jgi:elongation factor 2